jgi:hypothetical protein
LINYLFICPYLSEQVLFDASLDIIRLLRTNSDLNLGEVHGLTPLMCAILKAKHNAVIELVHLGADVNAHTIEGDAF